MKYLTLWLLSSSCLFCSCGNESIKNESNINIDTTSNDMPLAVSEYCNDDTQNIKPETEDYYTKKNDEYLNPYEQEIEDSYVPDGTPYASAIGDLNKDGIADSVCIVYYKDRSHTYFEYDTISIFFGTENNGYNLFLKETPLCCLGKPLIRSNGTLKVHRVPECNGFESFTFRYQNNDFYLIGYEDHCEGGEGKSINFSTKILQKEHFYLEIDNYGDEHLKYGIAKYDIEYDSLIPLRFLTDSTKLYKVENLIGDLKDTVYVNNTNY